MYMCPYLGGKSLRISAVVYLTNCLKPYLRTKLTLGDLGVRHKLNMVNSYVGLPKMCLTITSYCGFSPGMIRVIITPWAASPRCWFTGKLFRQHASWNQQLFAFFHHIRKAKQNFGIGKANSPHRQTTNFGNYTSWISYAISYVKRSKTFA